MSEEERVSTEAELRNAHQAENRITFLVVGESPFRHLQRIFLSRNHLLIQEAEDVGGVIEFLKTGDVEGALVEFSGSFGVSLEVIETLRRLRPLLPVVVASPQPSVAEAVRIMQLGVDSYVPTLGEVLLRPGSVAPELTDSVLRIVQRRRVLAPSEHASRLRPVALKQGLVAESEPMKAVLRDVALVAPARTTVLILGETGSGKERIAQAIHQGSPRRRQAFVAVNCAALSESLLETELFGHEKGAFTGAHCRREGRFKMADGGTLFLDEIGEVSPALQVKLLRVLQERQFERVGGSQTLSVDVRVIAATNRDLRLMVKEGAFRPDLFYRLNVMVLHLPALRDRPGDLEPLVAHILQRLSLELGMPAPDLGDDLMESLSRYRWPGNVRELENVLERLMILSRGRRATWNDLPAELQRPEAAPTAASEVLRSDGAPEPRSDQPSIPGATFRELERYAILRTYEACGHSPSRTAQILGLSLRTVHYRLREYRGASGRRRTAVLTSVPPLSDDDDDDGTA